MRIRLCSDYEGPINQDATGRPWDYASYGAEGTASTLYGDEGAALLAERDAAEAALYAVETRIRKALGHDPIDDVERDIANRYHEAEDAYFEACCAPEGNGDLTHANFERIRDALSDEAIAHARTRSKP